MDTLLLGVNDTLYNTLGGLWTNIFLASIDPNGQVNWKRNLTRENPDAYEVGCLARHPDGSVWYAHSDFSKVSSVDWMPTETSSGSIAFPASVS